jgi:hypothetical protein
MRSNKSPGIDGIPAEMWRNFDIRKGGIETLRNMFNAPPPKKKKH